MMMLFAVTGLLIGTLRDSGIPAVWFEVTVAPLELISIIIETKGNFHPKYGHAHACPHLTLKAGHSIKVSNSTLNMRIIRAIHGE